MSQPVARILAPNGGVGEKVANLEVEVVVWNFFLVGHPANVKQ